MLELDLPTQVQFSVIQRVNNTKKIFVNRQAYNIKISLVRNSVFDYAKAIVFIHLFYGKQFCNLKITLKERLAYIVRSHMLDACIVS